MISLLVVALVIVAAVAALGGVIGLVWLVLHLVAIAREAGRPPHQDQGNYQLSQGREVRSEEEHR